MTLLIKKEEKLMKTKKVVVGAVAAAMLSLAVCPVAPAAAGETVQISVGNEEVKAGEKFSVNVSLNDISAPGIQATDFAVSYDSSLITIDSVDAGALANTGAADADGSSSSVPVFEASINSEGYVNLVWSTGLDDSSYWLNGSGVFCTINGTVSASAKEGTEIPLKVTAIDRTVNPGSSDKAAIFAGYVKDDAAVEFAVETVDGSIKVASGSSTTVGDKLRGDANCDDKVDLSDAVLILQSIANADKYGENGTDESHITSQGVINADVAGGTNDMGGDGVTPSDALKIQKYVAMLITEAEL